MGSSLVANSTHNFAEVDGDGNGTWHFQLDGTTVKTTSALLYGRGHISTNTERHNFCDSLYAHYWALKAFNTVNGSWTFWQDLYCSQNSSADHHFDWISNHEHYVLFSGAVC